MIIYKEFSNESQENTSRARRSPLRVAGVFLAIASLYFGSTYAANISIGTGGNVEFGQGVQVTTACSGSTPLTLTPRASFVNVSGGGSLKFSEVSVSNIPSSCRGILFQFSSYGETATAPLSLAGSSLTSASVFMKSDSSFVLVNGASDISLQTLSNSSFKVTFVTPAANANLVYRMTLESKNGNCSSGINCAIGDTGPGGGVVFMIPSSSGNTTGKYFEIAPINAGSNMSMCAPSTNIGLGLSNAIGFGETNSALINANSSCNGSSYAVYAALNYSTSSASDWFLPSVEELKAAKVNAAQYLQINPVAHMSSSEPSSNSIWFVDFGSIVTCGGGLWPVCSSYKGQSGYEVRAIRTFTGVN
jgi:hypothetical protein